MLWLVDPEPLEVRSEVRKSTKCVVGQRGRCSERQQTDHRPDAEWHGLGTRHLRDVVVEAVLVTPQAAPIHGVGDVGGVFEELRGEVLIGPIVFGENQRHLEQVEAVHRHPRRAVGLFEPTVDRQLRRAVDRPDVVETEEAALEHVVALQVLSVDPPGEVQEQLVKDPFEEGVVVGAVCKRSRRFLDS